MAKLSELNEKALLDKKRVAEKEVADTIVRWEQARKSLEKSKDLEQATNVAKVRARQNLEVILLELQNRKLL